MELTIHKQSLLDKEDKKMKLTDQERVLIELYRSLPKPPTADARAVIVWKWEDAPEEYKEWCHNNGDEDWLAFVPTHLLGHYDIPWIESSSFAGHLVKTVIQDGLLVCGAHS